MNEAKLAEEIRAHRKARAEAGAQAMQRAALQILCGVDLDNVLAATGERRQATIRQLSRLIERERLKGARGHWSYDLNRHIALKQAQDRLAGTEGDPPARSRHKRKRRPKAPS